MDTLTVTGLQGRYMARAALDPAYRDEVALHWLCQTILTGEAPGTAPLDPQGRCLVAVAAIRGWVTTHA